MKKKAIEIFIYLNLIFFFINTNDYYLIIHLYFCYLNQIWN